MRRKRRVGGGFLVVDCKTGDA